MRGMRAWEWAFLTLVVLTLAFYAALYVADVTPYEFARYVGRHLVPDLSGI